MSRHVIPIGAAGANSSRPREVSQDRPVDAQSLDEVRLLLGGDSRQRDLLIEHLHKIETLYWIRELIEKGAAWFAAHGRDGGKGLRSFSVSGRVKKPGVKLAPAGVSMQSLIDEYCGGMQDGHTLYAYVPGAPRVASCART